MAITPTVATGQIITPAWGNEIRDRTNQVFASLAALKSAWPTPPDGAFAYLTDENSVCVAKGGTWRWWVKDFGNTTGANTSYFTYTAGATVAGSIVGASISGRTFTFRGHINLATPGASVNTVVGNFPAAYRIAAAMSQVGTAWTASTMGGRSILQATGDLQMFIVSGVSVSIIASLVSYQLPDLVAA